MTSLPILKLSLIGLYAYCGIKLASLFDSGLFTDGVSTALWLLLSTLLFSLVVLVLSICCYLFSALALAISAPEVR